MADTNEHIYQNGRGLFDSAVRHGSQNREDCRVFAKKYEEMAEWSKQEKNLQSIERRLYNQKEEWRTVIGNTRKIIKMIKEPTSSLEKKLGKGGIGGRIVLRVVCGVLLCLVGATGSVSSIAFFFSWYFQLLLVPSGVICFVSGVLMVISAFMKVRRVSDDVTGGANQEGVKLRKWKGYVRELGQLNSGAEKVVSCLETLIVLLEDNHHQLSDESKKQFTGHLKRALEKWKEHEEVLC